MNNLEKLVTYSTQDTGRYYNIFIWGFKGDISLQLKKITEQVISMCRLGVI